MRRLPELRIGTLLIFLCLWSFAGGAPGASEFDLRAVYLFHFTQFVEWPKTAYDGEDAPFVIGIIGSDPFGSTLSAMVHDEFVGRHPIVIRHIDNLNSARRCQILYVAKGGESFIRLFQLDGMPVLTVGESHGFSEAGGMIQFVPEERRIHLRINLTACRAHALEVSGKLLRVAEVVESMLPQPPRLRSLAVAPTWVFPH